MLQTSDEEIDQRIDAMMPGGGTVQASGMPPLVPFVPKALLLRVHNAVAAVEFQRRGSKQAALACVVCDMLWGTEKPLPRRDDRAGTRARREGAMPTGRTTPPGDVI